MKRSSITFILLLSAFAFFASCDSPDPEPGDGISTWVKAYGTAGSEGPALDIRQTPDGGFIMLGSGNTIISLNKEGVNQWQKQLSAEPEFIELRSLALTAGGEIVLAGRNGFDAAALLKLDGNGNVIWKKRIGWGASVNRYALDIDRNTGSIYLLREYNGSPTALVKKDADGNTLWGKNIGFDLQVDVSGAVSSLRATSDGGCIMAMNRSVSSPSGSLPVAIKLDADGAIEWQKTYGPSGGTGDLVYAENMDMFVSVEQTPDGGYIFTGRSQWGSMVWVLRADASGTMLWGREISSIIRSNSNTYTTSYPITAHAPADGGYVVAGRSEYEVMNIWTATGTIDNAAWIIKLSSSGAMSWQKTYREESTTFTATEEYVLPLVGLTEVQVKYTRNDMGLCSLAPVGGGGYIGAGGTSMYGAGSMDYMALKMDSSAAITAETGLKVSTRKATVKSLTFTEKDESVYVEGNVTEADLAADLSIIYLAYTVTDF